MTYDKLQHIILPNVSTTYKYQEVYTTHDLIQSHTATPQSLIL